MAPWASQQFLVICKGLLLHTVIFNNNNFIILIGGRLDRIYAAAKHGRLVFVRDQHRNQRLSLHGIPDPVKAKMWELADFPLLP